MTADRRARRDALLEEVLAMDGPARAAFLDRSCDSPSLRREIDELLSHDDAGLASLLDNGAEALVGTGLSPGDRVGRYVIEERVGAGGMSEVYRAKDPMIARRVALKVLTSLGSDEQRRKRFFAELRLLGRIVHDNVVRVYDFGEHAGAPYLVTELLEGEDLAAAIAAGRGGDVTARLGIARQIASALKDVHAAGILHRDIKPANVFIEKSGRAKLLDFGIARDEVGVTTGKLIGGTPGYIAPEQLNGAPATVRSDVYAFGVLLYELFSGERLYHGTIAQVLYAVAHEPVPIERLDKCPGVLVEIVRRATLKRPEERLQNFDDVVRLLNDVDVVPSGSDAVSIGAHRGGRRNAIPAALAGIVLLGSLAWWRLPLGPAPSPPPAAVSAPRRLALDLIPADQRGRDASVFSRLPIILNQDDRFRLHVSTAQRGHLYVFGRSAGGDDLNILFPSPLSYDGTSTIEKDATIQIPQTTWLEFGPRAGTEQLWVVWSAHPQRELESARQWANARDRGAILQADTRRRILALLDGVRRPWRSTTGMLQLEGQDDLLAGVLDIEHR